MYIIALNSNQNFYFISRAEQREKLEEKGILVLNATYDRITMAANAVRELNHKAERENKNKFLSKVG